MLRVGSAAEDCATAAASAVLQWHPSGLRGAHWHRPFGDTCGEQAAAAGCWKSVLPTVVAHLQGLVA